ncbi:hypothetical protein H6G20_01405 [Desertifilum sp. FACHB-1129]|uniref:Lipoprotein n=1 Tax=Desertifilum tharense IPPAS B-1220 TaxID=1781255 RepID=A0A1E5QFM0_9CYAN|nr:MULTISPECIES: hypothetical protein [Desertifilum]MDA0213278.1 hypothetical protein [Cyanobacteria bacterium FC1]MBD2310339.1 hypothetical protein [Desertifilum sp. FACHB-1129]MBD2321790.1 hypothetical protein [Desertifilum sp. FACHB-866]MBD2331917.1 hypothetical protein [Desertifilum sp. FACHB-868]OEJ73486.1 hypothetical protein BH720_19865 [Desertifilum tharense IPPAS B-1220]
MQKPEPSTNLHYLIPLSLGLLLLVGCSSAQTAVSPNPEPSVAPSPEQPATPPSSNETSQPPGVAQNRPTFQADSDNPNYLRDYEPTEPLPATGRVTIRGDARPLDPSNLFTTCPTDTGLYAYAESTNYEIIICSEEFSPDVPKTYISQAKDGSGSLRIVSQDRDSAYRLTFSNGGYTYSLYRDGARPEQLNAYLEVTEPNGKTYAEALLYLYEYTRRP